MNKCIHIFMLFFFIMVATIAISSETGSDATNATATTNIQIVKLSIGDLIKFIVIPLIIWFVKNVIVEAIKRYHLVRNLVIEIERNVKWYSGVKERYPKWKESNIDSGISPVEMSRITWNIPLFTKIYDTSQETIKSVLWGKEIPNIQKLYEDFFVLHVRIGVLSEDLRQAKRNKLESLRYGNNNPEVKALIKKWSSMDKKLILEQANEILKLLNEVCSHSSSSVCAEYQFYSKRIYFYYTALVVALLFALTSFIVNI